MATCEEENPFWRDLDQRDEVLRLGSRDAAGTAASSTSATSAACGSRTRRSSTKTHEKVLQLVADGLVDGLRIDHPDGLANPREYLERLRDSRRLARLGREDPRAGRALRTGRWRGRRATSSRTTSTALFVDPAGEEPMTALYEELTGERRTFARGGRRGEARSGADDVRAGVRAAPAALSARRSRGGGGRAPRLSHVRRARERNRRRRGPRRHRAVLPDDLRRVCCSKENAARSSTSSSFAGSRPPGR